MPEINDRTENRPVPPAAAQNTRTRSSDIFTKRYLDSLLVEMRIVDSTLASTEMKLFGERFKTPIMFGIIGRYDKFEGSFIAQAEAATEAGTVLWVNGRHSDEEIKAAVMTGAKVVVTIKPYLDFDRFLAEAKHAEELGAFAVATDIDHAYGKDGEYDRQRDDVFGPRSAEELKRAAEKLKVPFIAKGVLSVQDAIKCKEAGVSAVVLSHHHSIMDYAVPPVMILPEAREAVGTDYPIFVDCSIDTGADAFKALALGADGVLSARATMKCLAEGKEGFLEFIKTATGELRHYMSRTCSPDIKHIDPNVIRRMPF